jgi:hypothetical protein
MRIEGFGGVVDAQRSKWRCIEYERTYSVTGDVSTTPWITHKAI